jgi:nucleotide-binding universal stress UspA family protein
MTTEAVNIARGPVVFAYDGSDLARLAIDEAGRQLTPGQDAIVLTVWHPFDVGFVPAGGIRFDAAQISDVRQAAEQTALQGASLAQGAGVNARGAAAEAAPTWKGVVKIADGQDASLIVLGSQWAHRARRRADGSVAEAVAPRSRRSVLIIRQGDSQDGTATHANPRTEKDAA